MTEYLGKKDFDPQPGQLLLIDAFRPELVNLANWRTVHPFQRQHIAGGQIIKNFWHQQRMGILKISAQLRGIGCLMHHVQLIMQVFVKFSDHLTGLQPFTVSQNGFCQTGQGTHQCQILLDDRQNTRPDHFDGHLPAAPAIWQT